MDTLQNRKNMLSSGENAKIISISISSSKIAEPRVKQQLLRAKAAMLSAHLSHRNSVRLSVTRVDQAKTVQARISKFSPLAAWKTLVSGTVKLFRKFEGGHLERGR